MLKEIMSKEEFNEEVSNTEQLVLVDFWASWCEPCKQMLEIMPDVESMFPDVKFLKVKVDNNRALARELKIMSVPAIIIFKNGERVDFTTGFKNANAIEELVRKHL